MDQLAELQIGAVGVAAETQRLLDEAKQTMGPWLKDYERALKLAKLEAETEKKTFPFEDASIVMMPFILETMLDFHSRQKTSCTTSSASSRLPTIRYATAIA